MGSHTTRNWVEIANAARELLDALPMVWQGSDEGVQLRSLPAVDATRTPAPADDDPLRDTLLDDLHTEIMRWQERIRAIAVAVRGDTPDSLRDYDKLPAEITRLWSDHHDLIDEAERLRAGVSPQPEPAFVADGDRTLTSAEIDELSHHGHWDVEEIEVLVRTVKALNARSPQPDITRQQIADKLTPVVFDETGWTRAGCEGFSNRMADAVWALLAAGATPRDDSVRTAAWRVLTHWSDCNPAPDLANYMADAFARLNDALTVDGATPAEDGDRG